MTPDARGRIVVPEPKLEATSNKAARFIGKG